MGPPMYFYCQRSGKITYRSHRYPALGVVFHIENKELVFRVLFRTKLGIPIFQMRTTKAIMTNNDSLDVVRQDEIFVGADQDSREH